MDSTGSGAHPEQPGEAIRSAIAGHGPIRFDEFMDLALYGPDGYYERPRIGPAGDFVTSPHVHPVFGELLARALRELWTHVERPSPYRLVEIGAGDGTLARQLLEHLGDLPLRFTVIDRSAGAREQLRAISGVEVADEIPNDPHVVLGHELLDNLPFRLLRGAEEIRVDVDGGRFVEVRGPLDAYAADLAGPAGCIPPGEERIVAIGAIELIVRLAQVMRGGYALFVDYGTDRGSGGPVHGYRQQRVVADILDQPGTADITAGVDFGTLASTATANGLQAFPTVTQLRALTTLGFEERMREERAAQGALMNEGKGMDAVRRWAGRSRASLLVDPNQLGRLRWLGVATPGLPRPSFLAAAGQESVT